MSRILHSKACLTTQGLGTIRIAGDSKFKVGGRDWPIPSRKFRHFRDFTFDFSLLGIEKLKNRGCGF